MEDKVGEMVDREGVIIGIIGLGYVGLPLAVAFGKKYPVFGFDIDEKRVQELVNGYDSTLEISKEQLCEAEQVSFTNQIRDLQHCTSVYHYRSYSY